FSPLGGLGSRFWELDACAPRAHWDRRAACARRLSRSRDAAVDDAVELVGRRLVEDGVDDVHAPRARREDGVGGGLLRCGEAIGDRAFLVELYQKGFSGHAIDGGRPETAPRARREIAKLEAFRLQRRRGDDVAAGTDARTDPPRVE